MLSSFLWRYFQLQWTGVVWKTQRARLPDSSALVNMSMISGGIVLSNSTPGPCIHSLFSGVPDYAGGGFYTHIWFWNNEAHLNGILWGRQQTCSVLSNTWFWALVFLHNSVKAAWPAISRVSLWWEKACFLEVWFHSLFWRACWQNHNTHLSSNYKTILCPEELGNWTQEVVFILHIKKKKQSLIMISILKTCFKQK